MRSYENRLKNRNPLTKWHQVLIINWVWSWEARANSSRKKYSVIKLSKMNHSVLFSSKCLPRAVTEYNKIYWKPLRSIYISILKILSSVSFSWICFFLLGECFCVLWLSISLFSSTTTSTPSSFLWVSDYFLTYQKSCYIWFLKANMVSAKEKKVDRSTTETIRKMLRGRLELLDKARFRWSFVPFLLLYPWRQWTKSTIVWGRVSTEQLFEYRLKSRGQLLLWRAIEKSATIDYNRYWECGSWSLRSTLFLFSDALASYVLSCFRYFISFEIVKFIRLTAVGRSKSVAGKTLT